MLIESGPVLAMAVMFSQRMLYTFLVVLLIHGGKESDNPLIIMIVLDI